jgi:hypothetical protein
VVPSRFHELPGLPVGRTLHLSAPPARRNPAGACTVFTRWTIGPFDGSRRTISIEPELDWTVEADPSDQQRTLVAEYRVAGPGELCAWQHPIP